MTNPYDPRQGRPTQSYGRPVQGQPTQSYGQPQHGQPQHGGQQYGQPQYGQQYGQPQYGQPEYGQPQYGQPQYGQQYGQPQYGQPYGQPQYGNTGPSGSPFVTPPPKKGRGRLLAASAAVVVLAGGGVATYVAVSSGDSDGGAASPRDAVAGLVTDINNGDLIGVLDALPPGEREAIATPFRETVNELKRTGVVRSDANLDHVPGINVSATGLTYADKTITINDHVQVVQVTGGRVKVSARASQLPLTSSFLHSLSGSDNDQRIDQNVDIGQQVQQNGNKPFRVAAQKVGDRWYPSLFYTIADNATAAQGLSAPDASDRIAANGAPSADDAARGWVQALLVGQLQRAIELTSPDELGVLHDYGRLILDKAHYDAAPIRVTNLSFTDKQISGGTRVTLKSIEAQSSDGEKFAVKVDGDCLEVTSGSDSRRFCASDAVNQVSQSLERQLTSQERNAIEHAVKSLKDVGIATSQTDGKWYVNPVRTYFDLSSTFLAALQPGDFEVLVKLGNS